MDECKTLNENDDVINEINMSLIITTHLSRKPWRVPKIYNATISLLKPVRR